MRIYFENYRYPDKQSIFPYFQDRDTGKHTIPVQYDNGKQGEGWYVEHIGYLFVPVDCLIDKRVRERRHDEDDRHARVSEYTPYFFNKTLPHTISKDNSDR